MSDSMLTIARLEAAFPEPEFTALQRAAFADRQRQSAAFDAAVAAERASAPPAEEPPARAQMVRFGAYRAGELVGWSCGWFESRQIYYMANSGVRLECRRAGVYSALLEQVVRFAAACNAVGVRSQHSVLNNPIIVCKLRRGFVISGLSVSAQMGSLVELSLSLSPSRDELFAARVLPFALPQ